MLWPEFFVVVDDTKNALTMEELLRDLTWLHEPRKYLESRGALTEPGRVETLENLIKGLPNEITQLAELTGKGRRIVAIKVDTATKVGNVIDQLAEEGPAIAFIDFHYEEATADAKAKIHHLFQDSPQTWRDICDSDYQEGGCLFASRFGPGLGPPLRLLCPTTFAPPVRLGDVAKGAVTESVPLQRGLTEMMTAILVALRRWVELQNRFPLDEIWKRTKGWFHDDDRSEGLSVTYVPHTFPKSPDLESYREVFEEVFGLRTPNDWWASGESVKNIYESLKHLCGAHYCGTAEKKTDAKNNLSVGSAYLLSLLALRDVSTDSSCAKLTTNVSNFSSVPQAHRSILLPLQDAALAKKGATSLYYLFREMFREDPKHAIGGKIPSVKSAWLPMDGSRLLIQFEYWSASAKKLASALSRKLQDAVNTAEWLETERTKSGGHKLEFHLFNVWESLLTNERGFGSPGTIWMESDKLFIQGSAVND